MLQSTLTREYFYCHPYKVYIFDISVLSQIFLVANFYVIDQLQSQKYRFRLYIKENKMKSKIELRTSRVYMLEGYIPYTHNPPYPIRNTAKGNFLAIPHSIHRSETETKGICCTKIPELSLLSVCLSVCLLVRTCCCKSFSLISGQGISSG